ncbi:MAG: VWA domain-containing protein [Deltaproteobacteria bacterium]|nr:VWA domain-containing protein [Deltaproteobacteria bacterium]
MGFSAPYGLVSLLFLVLLVLLHRRRRQQRDLDVSSLLLWQAVPDEPARDRVRPNLLLAVQLALLGALALSVARPYWVERAASVTGGRAVLLFDASASMQTLERGERRFDQARRRAGEVLAGLGEGVEVMMIEVAAHPRVVVAFTRDRSLLARALEGLEPGDGPTRLSLGVQFAHSVAGGGQGPLEIDVFTDLPRQELAFSPAAGERLRYFRFGRSDDNVALAGLRVHQNAFQDADEARGYALVKNYAHRPKELELHVALDAKPVLDETLHLAARESRMVPIGRLGRPGRLEARLDVADALAVDNRAIAFVRPARKIRVVAVSTKPAVVDDLKALARGVPALDLRPVAPTEVRGEDLTRADLVVFHDFAPRIAPAVNALYVYPPASSALFPSKRDVVSAQILDWNESDPVLLDLRYLEALALDRSRLLDLPPWAHMLLSSRAEGREFPLAFGGETDGHRVICFAFDLEGRSLVRSENLSLLLLVLNALRWLTPPDSGAPLQIDVGESYRESLREPVAFTVTAPDGRAEARAPTLRLAVEPTRAGEYRIDGGAIHRTILANLFDGEESDVGRADGPGEESVDGAAAPRPMVSATMLHEFGRALLLAGFLLALAEWGYWGWLQRRRRPHVD